MPPSSAWPSKLREVIFEQALGLDEPELEAEACGDVLAELKAIEVEVAEHRAKLVASLAEAGWSYSEIGDAIGMSRQRVHQIANQMS